jgi:anaerobic ribonucleoside-triphosphate reductase
MFIMQNFTVIRKRNGTVVPFDSEKITNAVSKAFLKITGDANMPVAAQIKETAMQKLREIYRSEENGVPYVEQIQRQ